MSAHSGIRHGASVSLKDAPAELRDDQLLFNESQSRVVLSVAPEHLDNALALLTARGVPAAQIGTVGGAELVIQSNSDIKFPLS